MAGLTSSLQLQTSKLETGTATVALSAMTALEEEQQTATRPKSATKNNKRLNITESSTQVKLVTTAEVSSEALGLGFGVGGPCLVRASRIQETR